MYTITRVVQMLLYFASVPRSTIPFIPRLSRVGRPKKELSEGESCVKIASHYDKTPSIS